ncbi:uncharacterized protein LOC119769814 [Culex quinquefasciatus]|uniref:uncharacterized protein LOC119769814 n=1 Tax=Culex quinquefasciatus TaxID=7176 RepID=UPI0018E375C8|nr:uncharacterized protein LOC119769814 [Culex quinquefasciatus]
MVKCRPLVQPYPLGTLVRLDALTNFSLSLSFQIAGEMGAKMSRRTGRKAAAAAKEATPEIPVDETYVDRVAGGGRVDGGNDLAGGTPEPDPPVSEQNLTGFCFDHSVEPADPVLEAPVVIEIPLNNSLDNATAVPIPEPLVDQNSSLTNLTISRGIEGQIDVISVVPIPDPPVTEQNLNDDSLKNSERPVDPVAESTVIDSVEFSKPRRERYVRKINLSISDTSVGVPERQNSKKSVQFSDLAQVKEFTASESSIPILYSLLVKDPPTTVPELSPQNSKQIKYFWCYTCQNFGTNSLPWLLRLRYSKLSMYLRHLFCGSMCCAVICLLVFV